MPRTGVQYLGGDEPAFIKQFKQRIGHKEGPDVDTKRQIPTNDEDDDSDNATEKEDEKPMVVVLGSGDLTAEEAKAAEEEIEEGPARLDEKIVFRKPIKRSSTEQLQQGEKDKASESSACGSKKKKDSSKKNSSAKKTKTSNLLSFADDDEDDL